MQHFSLMLKNGHLVVLQIV